MAKRPSLKRSVPRHPDKKQVDTSKVTTRDHRVFRVPKHGKGEIDVLLAFSRPVDYQVVKLKTKSLPPRYGGRPITWLSAFGVKGGDRQFMKDVHFTAFFCVPSGRHLIRFEHGKLAAKPHPGKGIMYMEFESGDPAIGCD